MTDDQSAPKPADIAAANETAKLVTRQLKGVIRELTGWSVWCSDSGALYATRGCDLSEDETDAGLAQTVADDDARKLVEKIHDQVRRTQAYDADQAKKAVAL